MVRPIKTDSWKKRRHKWGITAFGPPVEKKTLFVCRTTRASVVNGVLRCCVRFELVRVRSVVNPKRVKKQHFAVDSRPTVDAGRLTACRGQTCLRQRPQSCEAGQGRKDRECANAVSRFRARGRPDISRDSLSRSDQLRPQSACRGLSRTSLERDTLANPVGSKVSPRKRSCKSSEMADALHKSGRVHKGRVIKFPFRTS